MTLIAQTGYINFFDDRLHNLQQEYFHAILFRDLVERHDIAHPKALTDLAHWLVDNTASHYSINSLTGYLKSLGHNGIGNIRKRQRLL